MCFGDGRMNGISKFSFISRAFTIKSKETRGSLLSTGFYLAIDISTKSDVTTLTDSPNLERGRHMVFDQTLHQHPQEVLLVLFFQEKNINRIPISSRFYKNAEYRSRARGGGAGRSLPRGRRAPYCAYRSDYMRKFAAAVLTRYI